ncbi:MAG TPA: serine hydrolase [Gemmatimonadaceae bacterium]|jgi:CubicO group peptidase (beta-lactamase class C family)
MRVLRSIAAIVVALPLNAAISGAQTAWPTKQWPTGTPQSVGLNVAVLDSINSEIGAGRYGYIDRMIVIRHGRLVYDRRYQQDYDRAYRDSVHVRGALNPHDYTGPYNYYDPWWHPYYRRGDLHTLQSVTKTITSMVIGAAVARGDFPSIDTPVLNFFDTTTVANIDVRKRRMTVRHLLTMTSGLDWNESLPYTDPKNTATALEESADWTKFTIDRPMSADPGSVFNYNSGASALLAYVFVRATGHDIEEYAAQHLFAPLGIERWYWKRSPTGLPDTEGGLYLEARDLAKLWYLVLKNGSWDGREVLSREWVRASVSPAVATGPAPSAARYGLSWWLYPFGRDSTQLYWAGSGFGGQLPIALRDDDIVVVFNGWNILPGQRRLPLRAVLGRIVNALGDTKVSQAAGKPRR